MYARMLTKQRSRGCCCFNIVIAVLMHGAAADSAGVVHWVQLLVYLTRCIEEGATLAIIWTSILGLGRVDGFGVCTGLEFQGWPRLGLGELAVYG